ncbi:methionine/alanine import family NSS transporter small subunit [Demequina globuliformis]|uniref:methionine/alanine import family NSS transporter small subunit n=1 Tax=Demequina globuliformis TaxID=676202 RepID=UPI000A0031F1|nr:methionine/alanine import family NSS transporter small subunit [Demequina globuliformis]
MSTEATVLMVVTLAVVWGGLIASILFLRSKPEADDMPAGGDGPESETGGSLSD